MRRLRMVKLIVKLAKWLENRFPEKLVVKAEQYYALNEEVSMLRNELKDAQLSLTKALERLSVVESNAVHKGAVSDLVIAVKTMKEDYATFKANTLGGNKPLTEEDMNEMFNGGPIHG